MRMMEKGQLLIEEAEEEIVEKIKKSKKRNDEVIKVVKKAEAKVLRNDKWQIKEGLVLKEEKIYILKDKKLRLEIFWLHHNTPIAGHRG